MGLSRHETHNSTLISSFNKSPKINVFRKFVFELNALDRDHLIDFIFTKELFQYILGQIKVEVHQKVLQ